MSARTECTEVCKYMHLQAGGTAYRSPQTEGCDWTTPSTDDRNTDKCDPLCEIQAKVSTSNYEKTSIKA